MLSIGGGYSIESPPPPSNHTHCMWYIGIDLNSKRNPKLNKELTINVIYQLKFRIQ